MAVVLAEQQKILESALKKGADFAELFIEDRDDVSIRYEHGVDHVAQMRTRGAGLYLMQDLRTVYVYTNSLEPDDLQAMLEHAADLLQLQSGACRANTLEKRLYKQPNIVLTEPAAITFSDKIALLKETKGTAFQHTPLLRQLTVTYFDRDQRISVANSEGLFTEDRRVSMRLRFVPVIAAGGSRVSYFSDFVSPAGWESFADGRHVSRLRSVLDEMAGTLTAREAPGGRFPVILEGGSCSGTFFHEACGHQLESTALLKNGLFWDKRGEAIASPLVTLVDDGTMPGMYGSSAVDDEGMPRQRNILIENGRLRAFLADRAGALRLNIPRSGSGRRQDYAHAPAARMSNTYLAAGQDDPEQIIRDTAEGLFVTGMGGGTGGDEFTLMASTAYWIRNGEILCPVKGAMLIGRGDVTMKKIDRVGSRFIREESGGSFCGAVSGFCPTTTSGPRLRIAEMVVGGRGGSL